MPTAPQKDVDNLLQYYPEDPAAGCPFDTGLSNVLSRPPFDPSSCSILVDITFPARSYKRIAAVQGDIVFHGPRRFLLKYRANKQDSWAFSMSNSPQPEFWSLNYL